MKHSLGHDRMWKNPLQPSAGRVSEKRLKREIRPQRPLSPSKRVPYSRAYPRTNGRGGTCGPGLSLNRWRRWASRPCSASGAYVSASCSGVALDVPWWYCCSSVPQHVGVNGLYCQNHFSSPCSSSSGPLEDNPFSAAHLGSVSSCSSSGAKSTLPVSHSNTLGSQSSSDS